MARSRAYQKSNREKKREYDRIYAEKNKERKRLYKKKHQERTREVVRKRKYGHLPGYDYAKNRLAQKEVSCDCCGSKDASAKFGWQLDHCHAVGVVRGVICHSCNCALGHAKDSIQRLEAMISYLKNPPSLREVRGVA